jgi:hypothetical protein
MAKLKKKDQGDLDNFYLLGGGINSPIPSDAGKQTIYQTCIAHFHDPLTPPQSKTVCVHTIKPVPGVVLCDGWHTYWRYMDVQYMLIVSAPSADELQKVAEGCLREAVVATALSGLISAAVGNALDLPALEAGFLALLVSCLKKHISGASASITVHAEWTGWE